MEKINDVIGLTRFDFAMIENRIMDIFERDGITIKEALGEAMRMISKDALTEKQKKDFAAAYVCGCLIQRHEVKTGIRSMISGMTNLYK